MNARRTSAWWWTRLELAIGVGMILLAGIVAERAPGPMFGGDSITIGPFFLRSYALVAIVALALAVVGLAWMLRIFRGTRDASPRWRYRDR